MIHLIPANDTHEHTLSEHCECNPLVEGNLVSHNAFDKREEREAITGRAEENKHWNLIEQ